MNRSLPYKIIAVVFSIFAILSLVFGYGVLSPAWLNITTRILLILIWLIFLFPRKNEDKTSFLLKFVCYFGMIACFFNTVFLFNIVGMTENLIKTTSEEIIGTDLDIINALDMLDTNLPFLVLFFSAAYPFALSFEHEGKGKKVSILGVFSVLAMSASGFAQQYSHIGWIVCIQLALTATAYVFLSKKEKYGHL